jgi:hypothetical protein
MDQTALSSHVVTLSCQTLREGIVFSIAQAYVDGPGYARAGRGGTCFAILFNVLEYNYKCGAVFIIFLHSVMMNILRFD